MSNLSKKVDLTERIGVSAVQEIFLRDFGWMFREQPILDIGIDAHVEIANDRISTSKLIAMQIKSGSSYFEKREKDEYINYYGDLEHLNYWRKYSLPVIVVLYNVDRDIAYWEAVGVNDNTINTPTSWKLRIPKNQTLDISFANLLESLATEPKSIVLLKDLLKHPKGSLFEPEIVKILESIKLRTYKNNTNSNKKNSATFNELLAISIAHSFHKMGSSLKLTKQIYQRVLNNAFYITHSVASGKHVFLVVHEEGMSIWQAIDFSDYFFYMTRNSEYPDIVLPLNKITNNLFEFAGYERIPTKAHINCYDQSHIKEIKFIWDDQLKNAE
ncbi:MAG TPA: DUF4365 domain-containing protein [Anaerolineae bacterium]|nr:DUF4365 domain-containing protein [Anaerolineae bacterium]